METEKIEDIEFTAFQLQEFTTQASVVTMHFRSDLNDELVLRLLQVSSIRCFGIEEINAYSFVGSSDHIRVTRDWHLRNRCESADGNGQKYPESMTELCFLTRENLVFLAVVFGGYEIIRSKAAQKKPVDDPG